MTETTKRLFRLRRFLRRKWEIGMTIAKSDWGNGWLIKQNGIQWTLFTVYIDQTDGYSFYRAIPNLDKGIDCEDEQLIVRTNDLYILSCHWEKEWQLINYGPPSTRIIEVWEGKLRQAFNG